MLFAKCAPPLPQEFYLIEQLGATHEAMPHLKAAVYVRPTTANIDILCRELADPKFKGMLLNRCSISPLTAVKNQHPPCTRLE